MKWRDRVDTRAPAASSLDVIGDGIVSQDGEEWMKRAACREAPDWVDFAPLLAYGEDPSPALAYCAACPVTAECLLWATAHDEPMGVWGGMTELERLSPKANPDATLYPCYICRATTCTDEDTACDACLFTVSVAMAS